MRDYLEHYHGVAFGRPDYKQNRCITGEECECEELHLRRCSPLASVDPLPDISLTFREKVFLGSNSA